MTDTTALLTVSQIKQLRYHFEYAEQRIRRIGIYMLPVDEQRNPAPPLLDRAFDEIEASILPSLSLLMDGLLDAATIARAGTDAAHYAAEIRNLSFGVAELTRQVEALAPLTPLPLQAPLRAMMSA